MILQKSAVSGPLAVRILTRNAVTKSIKFFFLQPEQLALLKPFPSHFRSRHKYHLSNIYDSDSF